MLGVSSCGIGTIFLSIRTDDNIIIVGQHWDFTARQPSRAAYAARVQAGQTSRKIFALIYIYIYIYIYIF